MSGVTVTETPKKWPAISREREKMTGNEGRDNRVEKGELVLQMQ